MRRDLWSKRRGRGGDEAANPGVREESMEGEECKNWNGSSYCCPVRCHRRKATQEKLARRSFAPPQVTVWIRDKSFRVERIWLQASPGIPAFVVRKKCNVALTFPPRFNFYWFAMLLVFGKLKIFENREMYGEIIYEKFWILYRLPWD